ncbi:MAG: TVP38/TMEM64 family protein [Clostridia bacterium]|nr:TVP38/TMEM64 family protein [Clostridia bacterium]
MVEFFKKNKKLIVNIILLLMIFLLISLISLFVLWAFDIVYFDDGINMNIELFDRFKHSWYGSLIVLLAQVVLTTLLCFVPGFSMAFILLVQALFDSLWQSFAIAFTGVMLSSLIMYLTGRFGGYRLCKKILGEKDCERASTLLNNKGAVFFPLMMMFPMFPDDALVMVAGTLKMSLKWFVPSIVFGRGIGIVTIIFGLGTIPYDKFTTPWHWIIFIGVCAVFVVTVFYLAYRFNKYLEKRNKKED